MTPSPVPYTRTHLHYHLISSVRTTLLLLQPSPLFLNRYLFFFLIIRPPPRSPLFPYPTLFRSKYGFVSQIRRALERDIALKVVDALKVGIAPRRSAGRVSRGRLLSLYAQQSATRYAPGRTDRKSTRLNSSHSQISYAVFCLKKK